MFLRGFFFRRIAKIANLKHKTFLVRNAKIWHIVQFSYFKFIFLIVHEWCISAISTKLILSISAHFSLCLSSACILFLTLYLSKVCCIKIIFIFETITYILCLHAWSLHLLLQLITSSFIFIILKWFWSPELQLLLIKDSYIQNSYYHNDIIKSFLW